MTDIIQPNHNDPTTVSILNDVNVPIPEEITDIEDFINKGTYKELSIELTEKYSPFVTDLLLIITEYEKISEYTFKDYTNNMKLLRKKYHVSPRQADLLKIYRALRSNNTVPINITFENIIRKKKRKSTSGIVSITVVLGPGTFSCPENCHYCPNDPSISRSYLLSEPAVHRGFMHGWDAFLQFMSRANVLYECGHEVTKVELLLLGGTFGSYPKDYTDEFVRDLYYAANRFNGLINDAPEHILNMRYYIETRLTLAEEIMINKYARCAIIGLTIETRPDWVNKNEIIRFREMGVTRVQLGIQHTDAKILKAVNRNCPPRKNKRGITLLKKNGFKVDGHFMPDLPTSSYEIDMKMFEYLFSDRNTDYQCDQLKIYPTMTLDYTKILEWYEEGTYKPYADDGDDMFNLLIWICRNVPYHIRLNRIIRDMPNKYIHGGVSKVNLRQDLNNYLKDVLNEKPRDIRGREVGDGDFYADTATIYKDAYRTIDGLEYFISYENEDRTTLYGFIRLRLNDNNDNIYYDCLKNAGLIRELHVYGQLVAQDKDNKGAGAQHLGIGTKLIKIAEEISYDTGFRKMAVISGVGVKRYYEKKGYHEEDTYMVKEL